MGAAAGRALSLPLPPFRRSGVIALEVIAGSLSRLGCRLAVPQFQCFAVRRSAVRRDRGSAVIAVIAFAA